MQNHTKKARKTINKLLASVIIINKNERDIAITLELLYKQKTAPDYEVIVVDASQGKMNDIYDKYPQLVRIDFVSKTTKKVTIPEQRNVGVRSASSPLIVFIDASCEPGPLWLKTLTKPILDGSELITAGGTLSSGGKTFHDVVYTTQISQTYIDQAPTINLAIDKKVFKKIGYFDENLRYGSDMDFTWRARKAGFKIRNVPKALITHDWGNFKSEIKRANHYGQAKTILYRKHRYGLVNFLKREFTMFFYIGYVIGLPLMVWFPFYPLFILIPVLKNWRTNPFKLVAINFVTAYGAFKEFIRQ